jgi:hypothetical protein
MATTEIETLVKAIKAVEEKIEGLENQLSDRGLSENERVAIRKNIDSYLTKEADLRAQKRELQGSAPSGNPINLSQSLHKVFECVVVVSFPLFCRGSSLPHISLLINKVVIRFQISFV